MRQEPLSTIDGGPAPADVPANLTRLLPRAARQPGAAITFVNHDGVESRLTYRHLLNRASRVLRGLRAAGARPGDRMALSVRDGELLVVGFWAGILAGLVVVPVGATPQHLPSCRWLLTGDAADTTIADGPYWIGTVVGLESGAGDPDFHDPPAQAPALVTLTAGTSGTPKAVVHTHGGIVARSAATIADNALGPGTTTVNWMPLDHVGGLIMFHLRDVQAAVTQVHADRSWILGDPLRLLDLVDRHRATVTWATTSALELIARHAEHTARSWDLSCLHYVMNGGEPIKAGTVRRFGTTLARFGLPSTAVRPGWGMSETAGGVVDAHLDTTTVDTARRWTPVGRPHPGVAVRVVNAAGVVVPERTVGRLQVRGASVSPGYADGSSRLTDDGWLDTGDLAIIDAAALTVTGSSADAMWIDGALHHAHELESTVAGLDFVGAEVAAALLPGPSHELVVAYLPTATVPDAAERIRDAVLAAHGLTVGPVVAVAPGTLPRTRTGKPQRAGLTRALAALSIERGSPCTSPLITPPPAAWRASSGS